MENKTAEKILKEHDLMDNHGNITEYKTAIIQAMEEYAKKN